MMWQLLLPVVGNVIDKLFPDAEAREKAKYELEPNCLINTVALDSVTQRGFCYTDSSCPVSEAKGFSVVGNHNVSRSVSGLSGFVSPSNISGAVISIVIYSVQRATIRLWPNVIEKCVKINAPFTANRYPAPSVPAVFAVSLVKAPSQHIAPRSVFGGGASIGAVAVLRESFSRFFGEQAATGKFVSCAKVAAIGNGGFPAVASTNPSSAFPRNISFYGNESPVPVTSNVYRFVCHFVTSKLITVNHAWQSAVIQIFGSYPSQAAKSYQFYVRT